MRYAMQTVAALSLALLALAARPGHTAVADQVQPLAHIAGAAGWIPDDHGATAASGGWQKLQWNYSGPASVQAPQAWQTLNAEHRSGARGVVIAVLDTGVAYADWHGYHRSPDFAGTRFIDPCDLIDGRIRDGRCTDTHPVDRQGHGTWVTSAIAESTNNRIGLTGLAYGATIMPIRVLNSAGWGYPSTIAAGIRYAVEHGAQVINLSLEFYVGVSASQIPSLISAIGYAHAHGVVVVGAAGNDETAELAYPARDSDVISVGASTRDGCLAEYSDTSADLDIVAPGGGEDASLHEPQCNPHRKLPDVYQMTMLSARDPNRFGLPSGWFGTSMATPAVSAGAAMVIASGILGSHPSPDQVLARLEQTAKPLGPVTPNHHNDYYGYGLLDVGAAVSRDIAPPATAPTTTTTTTVPTTTRTGPPPTATTPAVTGVQVGGG